MEVIPSPQNSSLSGDLKQRIQYLWQKREAEEPELSGREGYRESEALNWAYDKIPVSLFPPLSRGKVIELKSTDSIADAIETLSSHNILSAPVRDMAAPEDASWIDRYLGIVEYPGIVMWVLYNTDLAHAGLVAAACVGGSLLSGGVVAAAAVGAGAATGGLATMAAVAGGVAAGSLLAGRAMEAGVGSSGAEMASILGGDFFAQLKQSEVLQRTKVSDVVGSFRWAPFLPVQPSDSLLTLLLLVSKYRMRSVPVVESGQPSVINFITQSSVVDFLAGCDGLPWFDTLANKTLPELGLPGMKKSRVIKVFSSDSVLLPFQKMVEHGIGGVPVVEGKGKGKVEAEGALGGTGDTSVSKAGGGEEEEEEEVFPLVGNVSAKDMHFLLTAPEELKKKGNLTVADLMQLASCPHGSTDIASPVMSPPIRCRSSETLKDVILKLQRSRIHRVYITDDFGGLEGVITLRDIISKFVVEPKGYFGDFFGGVVPEVSPGKSAPPDSPVLHINY